MGKEALKEKIERYIKLKKDLSTIKNMTTLSFDLKEACAAYYSKEIGAILADPYVYDKIMGLEQGDGIL